MISVNFHKIDEIEKYKLKFAVIVAKYEDKWIVVRHKKRLTWEIPGGHIEKFEEVKDAASRELFEETGAVDFELTPVSIYSVSRDEEDENFGQLYYAEVEKMDELPESEIDEIKLIDEIPEDLTYPLIQPKLFEKVLNFIKV